MNCIAPSEDLIIPDDLKDYREIDEKEKIEKKIPSALKTQDNILLDPGKTLNLKNNSPEAKKNTLDTAIGKKYDFEAKSKALINKSTTFFKEMEDIKRRSQVLDLFKQTHEKKLNKSQTAKADTEKGDDKRSIPIVDVNELRRRFKKSFTNIHDVEIKEPVDMKTKKEREIEEEEEKLVTKDPNNNHEEEQKNAISPTKGLLKRSATHTFYNEDRVRERRAKKVKFKDSDLVKRKHKKK